MRRRSSFIENPIWIIIGINVLLYIATVVDADLLYDLGMRGNSFAEKPWTIVTCMFMHGGFFHIFANMFTLFFFGTHVAMLIGNKKFLLIYFLGGLLGNVFYLLLGNPNAIVVGASGAVFAVGGTLTMLRPNLKVLVFPIPVPISLWMAVIGMFLIISIFPNVAWQAHLGGLLLGLAAGRIFKNSQRNYYYY